MKVDLFQNYMSISEFTTLQKKFKTANSTNSLLSNQIIDAENRAEQQKIQLTNLERDLAKCHKDLVNFQKNATATSFIFNAKLEKAEKS